ncbi:MAG: DUF1501 domain-containing protein [Myxococcota bacterium]
MTTSRGISRRSLVLGGGGLLMAKALATGLPTSFLNNWRFVDVARAQSASRPTFTLLALGGSGDPLNTNVPGMYPDPGDDNDSRRKIAHPSAEKLGDQALGSVNGIEIFPRDFENPSEVRLGDVVALGAKPWAVLPEALRNRMRFIHHGTYANAHPEAASVRTFHGALKGPSGVGTESLPAFLAQETARALGTTVETPVAVGGPSVFYEGRKLRLQSPKNLQALFAGRGNAFGLSRKEFANLRDRTLDAIYSEVRREGTHAQRTFIDSMARSRSEALSLGDELAEALEGIRDNEVDSQIQAALSLFEKGVAPVVSIQIPFGQDNHGDSDLGTEASENTSGVEYINRIWRDLVDRGLQDRVTFAFLNVFGRDFELNTAGGRQHNANHHAMVIFGPNVSPGVVGSVEYRELGNNDVRGTAMPIGDIPFDETLQAAGKTLAHVVGVPDSVIDERISGGKIIV